MNNRGQVLVLFICLLPIMLLVSVIVIDVVNVNTQKRRLDDINEMVIDYGLEHLSDENLKADLESLLLKNDKDIDNIVVEYNNNSLTIKIEKKEIGIVSNIVSIKEFQVISVYEGIINDGVKEIKRGGL